MADLVVAMESVHRKRLLALFPTALRDRRIAVLDIPDRYRFMEQELIALLQERMRPLLPKVGHSF